MGTIIGRSRKDGSKAFIAQIVIKKDGVIAHREAQTFDRKPAANAWIVKREAELKRPGGLERKEDPTLAAVIDRYIAEFEERGPRDQGAGVQDALEQRSWRDQMQRDHQPRAGVIRAGAEQEHGAANLRQLLLTSVEHLHGRETGLGLSALAPGIR